PDRSERVGRLRQSVDSDPPDLGLRRTRVPAASIEDDAEQAYENKAPAHSERPGVGIGGSVTGFQKPSSEYPWFLPVGSREYWLLLWRSDQTGHRRLCPRRTSSDPGQPYRSSGEVCCRCSRYRRSISSHSSCPTKS